MGGGMNTQQYEAAKLNLLSRPSKREVMAGNLLCSHTCMLPTPNHPNTTLVSECSRPQGKLNSPSDQSVLGSSPAAQGSSLSTLLLWNTFPGSTVPTHETGIWGMSRLTRHSWKCKWNASPNMAYPSLGPLNKLSLAVSHCLVLVPHHPPWHKGVKNTGKPQQTVYR